MLLFFDGAISIVPKDSSDSKILEFHYTLPDTVPATPVSVAWDDAGAGNLLQRPANVYDGNVWDIPLSEEVYDYGVYAENQFFTSSPGTFAELSFDEDLVAKKSTVETAYKLLKRIKRMQINKLFLKAIFLSVKIPSELA